jgi:glutathione peroxidase
LRNKLLTLIALAALLPAGEPAKLTIYSFNLPDIKGKMVAFDQFKGKTLLIVNVASQSSFTPQYAGLETLYEKYKGEGLVVLAFPSNDFGAQEPEPDAKIAEFCEKNYHVTFPLFSKVAVRGDDIIPLFTYLTQVANPKLKGEVHWNFSKFVVDRKGKLTARFGSDVAPDDPDLVVAVETALKGAEEPAKEEAKPESAPTPRERRPPDGA